MKFINFCYIKKINYYFKKYGKVHETHFKNKLLKVNINNLIIIYNNLKPKPQTATSNHNLSEINF